MYLKVTDQEKCTAILPSA